MSSCSKLTPAVFVVIATAACAAVVHAQPYRYEMTLMPERYTLEDINNHGAAVGTYSPSGNPARGIVWTEIDGFFYANSPETPAENVRFKGISDDGLIAATAYRNLGASYPYARAHTYDRVTGEWTMIHPWSGCSSEMQDMSPNGNFCGERQALFSNGNCGSQFSTGEGFAGSGTTASTIGLISQYPDWAHSINSNGDVCGEGYLSDGSSVRGTYRPAGGSITALPGLGGAYAMAYGLNDNGLIAGYASRPGDNEWVAVIWTQENGSWQIKELAPGDEASLAWDVNTHGQVVGWLWDFERQERLAHLWYKGQPWDLNTLTDNVQGVLYDAKAISDTGWIVGQTMLNGKVRDCVLKPIDRDTDLDGLLDSWEILGVDINNDGTIDLDLPAMGADPNHKDLFVEIDRMPGVPFYQGGLDDVVNAFFGAPLENPDGTTGVTAHLMVDEADLPFLETWDDSFVTYGSVKAFSMGTSAERSSPNWTHIKAARERVFRYCTIINRLESGAVGRAEMPGDDMIISMGGYAQVNQDNFASTFMHELGHNLDLDHGGGDGVNYKPNYVSCMNYNWDVLFIGNDGTLLLDYSREALPALNESSLDETAGFANGQIYLAVLTIFGQPDGSGGRQVGWVETGTQSFDWDADGNQVPGTVADLNWMSPNYPGGAAIASPGQTLKSYDDWANVALPIGVTGSFQDSIHTPPPFEEPTADEKEWLLANTPPAPGGCPADTNGDGILDNGDISAFVALFLAGDLAADLNGDSLLDNGDIGTFIQAFLSGC